jgi:uncharacterized protein YuzE
MNAPYLEVTFRHGRPIAAYLYLQRKAGDKSHRTVKAELGMMIDYEPSGRAIGIEITAPGKITQTALNRVLLGIGAPPVTDNDIAPLQAA